MRPRRGRSTAASATFVAMVAVVVAALALVAGACSGDDPGPADGAGAGDATSATPTAGTDDPSTTTATPRPATGAITVLAEPGLAPTMSAFGVAFEEVNPEASVAVEALAPAEIVARVEAGGGDVVVLSDTDTMDQLEGTGAVAAVLSLPRSEVARAGAVVASPNPRAATRFVEFVSR